MTKVLGKGLGALIRNYNSNVESEEFNPKLPIEKIISNKKQPRKSFDQKQLNSLVESVKEKGIIQPISVRKINDGKFEIIAGERRYRASKQINLPTIPAYILKIDNNFEMMELALIENIQRSNLNAMEEAEGYLLLKNEYNFSQSKIAKKISKSRPEISNKMRLLKLPKNIQQSLKNREIEYGHARTLLSIQNKSLINDIYKKIIIERLSVRNTEVLIKKINNPQYKNKSVQKKLTTKEKKLTAYFKANVKIKFKSKDAGKIEINFNSKKNLNKIIKKITNEKKL
jgi:ParB family chromosome partitioning protein